MWSLRDINKSRMIGGMRAGAVMNFVHRSHQRDSVFANMELPAHGQRRDAAFDRIGLCEQGLQSPHNLHAGGTMEAKS
jgi:hypothetical protein